MNVLPLGQVLFLIRLVDRAERNRVPSFGLVDTEFSRPVLLEEVRLLISQLKEATDIPLLFPTCRFG